MNLTPRSIILLAIDAFGGQIDGKTLLQKRLYFTEILSKESLDLEFDAHYYGPYSATVNSELTTLKVQGLLQEDSSTYGYGGGGFEMRKFQYKLSDSGKVSVEWLHKNHAEESGQIVNAAKRVIAAGNLDYMDLSFAAKSHWILRKTDAILDESEIAKQAGRFGWDVKPEQIGRGLEFLRKVGLVRPQTTAATA